MEQLKVEEPRIIEVQERKFVGMHMRMNMQQNRTAELFQAFMPRKKEVKNSIGNEVYAFKIYEGAPLPTADLERWAAVEVEKHESVPEDMEAYTLAPGKYAVFTFKGTIANFPPFMGYIFGSWLPNSGFSLDNRPHMEVLGEKYLGTQNPESEEEIWIPIR